MTTDAGLEQAVRDAATAAGVRPDRVQLVSRLLPPTVLTRTAENRIDPHAINVAVRGVLHLIPEWVQPPTTTPTPTASDTTDLVSLMHQAVGITTPGATR